MWSKRAKIIYSIICFLCTVGTSPFVVKTWKGIAKVDQLIELQETAQNNFAINRTVILKLEMERLEERWDTLDPAKMAREDQKKYESLKTEYDMFTEQALSKRVKGE
jgi:hypothetical protein